MAQGAGPFSSGTLASDSWGLVRALEDRIDRLTDGSATPWYHRTA